MIPVKLWILSEEGFEKGEQGIKEGDEDWILQDALIDIMDVSYVYEARDKPGAVMVMLKSTSEALMIQATVQELYEAKKQYVKENLAASFFQAN